MISFTFLNTKDGVDYYVSKRKVTLRQVHTRESTGPNQWRYTAAGPEHEDGLEAMIPFNPSGFSADDPK